MLLPASFNPFLSFLQVDRKSKQAALLFTTGYMIAPISETVRHFLELPGSSKTKVKVNETYRPYTHYEYIVQSCTT